MHLILLSATFNALHPFTVTAVSIPRMAASESGAFNGGDGSLAQHQQPGLRRHVHAVVDDLDVPRGPQACQRDAVRLCSQPEE